MRPKGARLTAAVALLVLTAPLVAEEQQADRVRQLGLLLPYIERDVQAQARVTAFRDALRERGWVDGKNVRFEFRYTLATDG